MIISFASGKGGTGKTTVATNFALLLAEDNNQKIQFLDCDVEEPNASIFLKPEITETTPIGIPVPVVDFDKCTYCGKCAEICAYNAIAVLNPVRYRQSEKKSNNVAPSTNSSNGAKQDVLMFSELCHGCGGCMLFCPEQAISEKDREIGIIENGKVGTIEFTQGKLNVGEPMASPVIREMKRRIRDTEIRRNGEKEKRTLNHLTIIDVPPGTSCPMIEATKGSDFTVLVTEPTPFGLNDLVLAVETMRKLNIPIGVVINRSTEGNDKIITTYCDSEGIPILTRIPMDREIAVAYSKGIPIIHSNDEYRKNFQELHQKIFEAISEEKRQDE